MTYALELKDGIAIAKEKITQVTALQQSLKTKVLVKDKMIERNEKNTSSTDEMKDIQSKYSELTVLSTKETQIEKRMAKLVDLEEQYDKKEQILQ